MADYRVDLVAAQWLVRCEGSGVSVKWAKLTRYLRC